MFASALLLVATTFVADPAPLDGTAPLEMQGDIPMQMVAGIDAYLSRALDESIGRRAAQRGIDPSFQNTYVNAIDPARQRLASIIGAVDKRDTPTMEIIGELDAAEFAASELSKVYRVRWRVFRGVDGEGLLVEPSGTVYAQMIVIPDCDTSPEAFLGLDTEASVTRMPALSLVAAGVRVIVPVLIDRSDEFSGTPGTRMTNQPHREFIYRTGYELGRHIIGYEVQKTMACLDWFESQSPELPTAIAGYGEGGLIALFTGAIANNVDSVVISGYFQPREHVWREPIYRNVWSLLHESGDAEIATLIAPRSLLVEACEQPIVSGPPAPHDGRDGAAPGAITTPPVADVVREVERARTLVAWMKSATIDFVDATGAGPFGKNTIAWLQKTLALPQAGPRTFSGWFIRSRVDARERMKRQVQQLVDDTQYLMHQAEFRRKEFWAKADKSSPEAWAKSVQWYRDYFNEEAIGALSPIELPPNARTRLVYDEPAYRGYEVVLDVFPDVFAYGILLIPKDIAEGERRPVVVCQHGLEGRVQDVADPSVKSDYYHQFACKLAEQGFIAYAPQNPYIGEDKFRVLQRKANPLKLSLFSFIVRQHEQTLKWLGSLAFVDAERIAFYGLSYGGKTAMRVPALLDGYCLSICSGDYNEWIWKCVSVNHPLSYIFTGEDEMWEWNMGNTFNHAEMSWMIYPRPFMVERGHHDGVGYDEWVAYEFAKTKRHYVLLGSGDDAQIEYFNGPHTINGVGTFDFLRNYLNWPRRN